MSVARLNSAVVLLLAGMFTGQDGLAACSGPPGVAGDQIYNSSYSVMQFCNGTNWINMGGVASNVTAAGASGAIQFNTGNALDADAALTWDTTNDRLGIGTSTPAYNLDVMGSAAISGALSLGGTVSGPTTIGIGTSAASSKAVLDVVSTTGEGTIRWAMLGTRIADRK